jgi:hypothetical protein
MAGLPARSAVAALALAGWWLAPADAQTPAASSGTLTVRLAAGTSVYQIGEAIPLELEFRVVADARHIFIAATYDRSGRMPYETYEVTPREGWSDPQPALFRRSIMGGLFTPHPLDGTPWRLKVTLNDWVRFSSAGTYRLVVRSGRVSGPAPPKLESDPIELTIVPADERVIEPDRLPYAASSRGRGRVR